jgi:NOL1/NOP2/fmu family ribosome biogenesis protein
MAMRNLKILSKKEIKKILSLIKSQFGAEFKHNYAFFQTEKGKIYLMNRDISKIDTSKIRINSLGLYFAELRGNEIRLSIEGSQLIGPIANKNILSLDDKQAREWMRGEDLEIKESKSYSGFLLIRHNNDFLGAGKLHEGKVLNFVGKGRRISAI